MTRAFLKPNTSGEKTRGSGPEPNSHFGKILTEATRKPDSRPMADFRLWRRKTRKMRLLLTFCAENSLKSEKLPLWTQIVLRQTSNCAKIWLS